MAGITPSPRTLSGIAGAALASLMSLAAVSLANAQSGKPLQGQTIVLYTSGGTQLETTKELVIAPFESETGAKVIVDDSCCSKLQAAMEAGDYLGDLLIGLDRSTLLSGAKRGWLIADPRIDKIARDRAVSEGLLSDSVLTLNLYSYIIAAKDQSLPLPKSWAEFWDTEKFPGTRGFVRTSPKVQLEAALLADGVAADSVYPIDVDRAFKKLDELKGKTRVIMNATGADQINNLGTGEVTYSVAYSNRAYLARRDGIGINFSYADGFIVGNGAALLKGSKNVEGALALLEYHMRPDILARFAERTGMAPPFKASVDQIRPEYAGMIATSAQNISQQHMFNDAYWEENLPKLTQRWIGWLAQ